MKFILTLLLVPLFTAAQRDFDYSLYTGHAQDVLFLKKDSSFEELVLERRILKEGSRLSIIPLFNTGNSKEYHIFYVGFGMESTHDSIEVDAWGYHELLFFHYTTEDMKVRISICPTVPIVEFHEIPTGKLLSRYY